MSDAVVVALIAAGASVVTVLLQLYGHRKQNAIQSKVDEAHHQLAVNNHSSAQPTVLDKLDELKEGLRSVNQRFDRHEAMHQIERELR